MIVNPEKFQAIIIENKNSITNQKKKKKKKTHTTSTVCLFYGVLQLVVIHFCSYGVGVKRGGVVVLKIC